VVPTLQRNKAVDLTLPWAYDNYAFLIPVPDETANINAVVRPFQWPVCRIKTCFYFSYSRTSIILLSDLAWTWNIDRFHHHSFKFNPAPPGISIRTRNTTQRYPERKNRETTSLRIREFAVARFIYIIAIIRFIEVSQNLFLTGEPCPSKRLAFRLVAGVWILAAFFFVQAYTSILYSYLVTPIYPPLINSIYDIINSNDINLYVRESGYINALLQACYNRN
jgi:ionotropic glutamate receptor